MTNYLQHVALRMDGNASTREAMILPGKVVSFPARLGREDEQTPMAPGYPVEDSPTVTHEHKHYHIVPESAKSDKPSPWQPTATPSYIRARLQHPVEASVVSKIEKPVMAIDEPSRQKIPAPVKPADPKVVEPEGNIIPGEKITRILKIEQQETSPEKETRIEREIRQPEHIHHTHILPPEPLPPQKIPTVNKLTIGKINVEIVRPPQPVVKTKERVVTRIVSTGANESVGTNKLSFGLKQF